MILSYLRNWYHKRKAARVTVPDALWRSVEDELPFLAYLAPADRARLREYAREFLATKQFHGADGFELTDEIMLSVALQACLPVLNIGLHVYQDWVGIIIYLGDIRVRRHETDEFCVVHEFDDEILGEAWEAGPVVLAWTSYHPLESGANVVIHEFAHKLDMSNGTADGFPPLPATIDRASWARDFSDAYTRLCDWIEQGIEPPINPYAAQDPAEFFAVVSEVFFKAPDQLQHAFPEVYRQLSLLYGVDTLAGRNRALASHKHLFQDIV